ncbi:MAG: TraV family lipoprotein, partial [bacterium]
SGCATTYTGNKLLRLPSGKPVNNTAYYRNLLEKKSMLSKDRIRLEESLINRANTPIYIHSKILRMLVMPYIDTNGRLHTYQYIYFKVKKGGWLLGNYLMKSYSGSKIFNPLGNVKSNSKLAHSITTYAKPKPVVKQYRKPKGGFYQSVFQRDINAAKKQNSGE